MPNVSGSPYGLYDRTVEMVRPHDLILMFEGKKIGIMISYFPYATKEPGFTISLGPAPEYCRSATTLIFYMQTETARMERLGH